MKAITVESICSELATRTLECLVLEDCIREPHENSIRVVARVNSIIPRERLILSGQFGNLEYIEYISKPGRHDYSIIKWITSDGIYMADDNTSLSDSLAFKKSYTIQAIKMLVEMLTNSEVNDSQLPTIKIVGL